MTKLSNKLQLVFGVVFAILSFLGFLDSAYLTANHYFGLPLNCYLVKGCDIVTTSKYSVVFGVPVALFGFAYYLLVLILSIAFLDTRKKSLLFFIAYFSPIGFLASAVFTYLQFFVIKSFCFYCLTSAVTSTLIFLTGIYLYRKKTNHYPGEELLESL